MTNAPDIAPAPAPNSRRPAWASALRALALCAAVLTLGNATWAAWDQDITYDEPFHVGWPEQLLRERNDAREQFLFDSKTPALLPGLLFRMGFESLGVASDQGLRFATRFPSVLLLALVLFAVFRLARTEDPATAWIGLLIAALDTNLSAHASVATSDLPYTLVVLLLAIALTRHPSRAFWAGVIGAILGLSLAVKYTGVLLFPIAFLVVAIRGGASARERAVACLTTALAAWFTVCTLYLWVGVMTPMRDIPLQTPGLKAVAALAPGFPLPAPRAILTGIDLSIAHNRADLWNSYIFGADHRGGVWYYFVAQWLMKTPVALLPLVLAGIWKGRKRRRDPSVIVLGGLLLIHLLYFSLFFATQIGLRFALQCVALSCALAARGLRGTKPSWLLAVVLLAAAERAPYYGDPLAFTNLSVWPKSRAWWYTADSNLEWGQNRYRVERYARDTGQAMILRQPTLTPGLFVVSANDLAISERRRAFAFLAREHVPATLVGFTHFAFSITRERFEDYMNADRLASPSGVSDEACAPPLGHYSRGAQIPFEKSERPGDGRVSLVCVISRKSVDIGFTTTEGRAWFGRMTPGGECEADLIQKGQQAWFRVPRATEVRLCIREMPYRRRELEYRTSGYITVRGQGADVAVRPGPDPRRESEDGNPASRLPR